MSAHTAFQKANDAYVQSFGDKGSIPLPPGKKLIVLTCMDARIDPAQQLGLKEGDSHVIRNAGGVAKEAIRSIVISQRLLGTREIAVFHHTGCGMLTFSTPQLRDLVKKESPNRAEVGGLVDSIDFLEFDDEKGSVEKDVEYLRNHPLLLEGTAITGWLYHVETGKITQVA
jgi:carbonic anhydrase